MDTRDSSNALHARRPFDPVELFDRKNNFNGYRWCPLCGARLEQIALDGRARMVCQVETCGFVYYQNPAPGAGVLVHNERGILLVKRAHPPQIGFWCLPAGYMEWEEAPAETAVREAKEETGLTVVVESLFGLYSGFDDPRTNTILVLYVARVESGELRPGDDAQDAKFFPPSELPVDIAFAAHRLALDDFIRHLRRSR